MFATNLEHWLYTRVAKPIFFKRDPEFVHDRVTRLGKFIGRWQFGRAVTKLLFYYAHPSLEQDVLGMHFANPVGLTAGFDKNAELTDILPSIGFGFAEIGSVTGERCEGNPKPRLWRLPESKGLVVWYGLKNDGCETIAERLNGKEFTIPIGVSVAKTNCRETADVEAGIADYAKAFATMEPVAEYLTVNISCPNTYGGEPFVSPALLERLLAGLDQLATSKPVFLKMPCDLTTDELEALMDVAERHRVDGLILSNLTKQRDRPEIISCEIKGIDKGGISGKPVSQASNALIAHAYKKKGKRIVIIGVGGIFTAEDAYEKIRQGATLVQLATGMIFEGPQVIGEINRGLVELLKKDGYTSITQAIGSAHSHK